jgi:peptidoglycan hydrolase-like protein with peptidoglycan-binding domain
MRSIVVALVGVSVAAGVAGVADVAAARGDEEAITCATAINAPNQALDSVIAACSEVIPGAEGANLGRLLRYRGWALERKGERQRAIADYDDALRLLPDDLWTLQGRARAHRASGNVEQARQDYQRLHQLQPDTSRWRIELAELGVVVAASPVPPDSAEPKAGEAAAPETAKPDSPPPSFESFLDDLGATITAPGAGRTLPSLAAAPPVDPTELVRRLQTALRELGYFAGPSNGRLGPLTREAVAEFAADAGLQVGAEPDEGLVAAAEAAARERRVQAAEAQRALNRRAQQSLAALGHEVGDIDGIFGPRSREALADWLRAQGRPAGGEVDEALVASLEAAEVAALDTPAAVAPPPAAEPPGAGTAVAWLEQAGDDASAKAAEESAAAATDAAAPPAVVLDPDAGSPQPLPARAAPEPAEEPQTTAIAPADDAPPPEQRADVHGVARLVPAVATDERRVALVIGNSAYENVEPLKNPRQDAGDMARALADIGFEVFQGIDLDRNGMDDLTATFAREAEKADLALAYYSGHGLQFEGANYLVPVDGRIQDWRDLRRLVRLDQLIEDTSEAGKLAVVVVDACRNDPLSTPLTRSLQRSLGGSRSADLGTGLAQPGVSPPQTLIAYATAPGSVAYDGEGRNSPYVAALLRHLKKPGVEVRRLFGFVQDDVVRETGDAQRPVVYNSLGGEEVFLVPGVVEPKGLELAQLTRGEVRAIQRSLGWLGFWPAPADGEASPELVAAVRSWQGSQYAEATGRLTVAEIVALHRRALRDRPREPLPSFDLSAVLLRSAAGEAEAQRLMGMVYDPAFEAGVFPKDRGTARVWYEKAAAQDDAAAAGRLGLMLAAPGGPAASRREARRWLEAAARAGEPQAALRLAELLLGDGADAADRPRAVELLKVAAASAETDGLANAFLRDAGVPPVVQ